MALNAGQGELESHGREMPHPVNAEDTGVAGRRHTGFAARNAPACPEGRFAQVRGLILREDKTSLQSAPTRIQTSEQRVALKEQRANGTPRPALSSATPGGSQQIRASVRDVTQSLAAHRAGPCDQHTAEPRTKWPEVTRHREGLRN